jgi:hypothetical protein
MIRIGLRPRPWLPRSRAISMLDYAVHVALLAAFQLIMAVPEGPDRAALCDEARADLDVMLKAALTPDSVYEAIERRSRFKLVPKEPE